MTSTAPPRTIAIIDIGKTNAKLVVLDAATGHEIAVIKTPNRVLPGPPYPHYDIEALWDFLGAGLKRFAKEPGFDAISITTHGASAVLLCADGTLALPVLDYEHSYPQAIRNAYADLRPPFSQTFSPPLAGGLNLGAQLHFQKTAFPQAFDRTHTIMTYPQYWAWRLTGVAANEVTSLGCHTDLWQPTKGVYSALVDTLGISALMAPVRSAFDPLGPVRPEVARPLGLSTSVAVYCGIHDSNASLLPHLVARKAPFSVVSTGTWVVSFAVGGDVSGLDPARDTLVNVNAYGEPVPSARFMGGREFEMLTADLATPSSAELDAACRSVLDGPILLLPSVVEGCGPFPARTMRWTITPGSPAERHAAASLYAALMTDTCLGLIGAGGPVIVEGPFADNRVFLHALAALTGREVFALPDSTGTSAGAAMLTGLKPDTSERTAGITRQSPQVIGYRDQWRAAIAERGDGA